MAKEHIDREAVLAVIRDAIEDSHLPFGRRTFDSLLFDIQDIPAADVAPVVRGEWMVSLERPVGTICSKCGFAWSDKIDAVKLEPILSKIKTNYCPNCGADMRGVATDTNVGDAET